MVYTTASTAAVRESGSSGDPGWRRVRLTTAGGAAGGLLSGGSALRRAALAVGAGVVGVAGYFGLLFGLTAFAPMG